MKPGSPRKSRIILTTPEGMQSFSSDEIRYCKADGNYTFFHIAGRDSAFVKCQTLKKTQEELNSGDFFRTRKSFLINFAHLKAYRRGISIIVLDNDEQVCISRRNKKLFLKAWKERGC